jgi:hypothetical protein
LATIPDIQGVPTWCAALFNWDKSTMMRLCWSVVGLLLLSGCASFLHSDVQPVQVTVLCNDRVVPAACVAQNGKGVWQFQAPGTLQVNKDLTSLQVTCKSLFFPEITAAVPSRLNLSMAGNLLMGGIVGAGVDVYRGTGFAYHPDVRIAYPACK